jgi:hypothetical protein
MTLCYDFEKWTMITLASVAISLTIGLVSLAFGQSIDDLKNQANQEAKDRIEYIAYIKAHNITHFIESGDIMSTRVVTPENQPMLLDIEHSTTDGLLSIVSQHIEDCANGLHDKNVAENKYWLKDAQQEKDDKGIEFYQAVLGTLGRC